MPAYSPSGKVDGAGIAKVLVCGLAAAAIAAPVVHYLGRLFYLILLYPIIWGAGLGMVTSMAVSWGKCRNVSFAVIAAVLASTASYGFYHLLENGKVRSDIMEAIKKDGASPEEARKAYDEHLRKQYGGTGFWAEMKIRSELGMNIGRRGLSRHDSKPMITGMGMYIYWIIELGIMAFLALTVAKSGAAAAFCESCEEWYKSQVVAKIAPGKEEEARMALGSRNGERLGACVQPSGLSTLTLEKCPKCSAGAIKVVLEQVIKDKKGNDTRTRIFDEMITREEANKLLAGVVAPPPADGGSPPQGLRA